MDRAAWLQQRRRRYLARILTDFETYVEPLIPKSETTGKAIETFKGSVRAKLNALAVDAIDVYGLSERGVQINAAAQDLKDTLDTRQSKE